MNNDYDQLQQLRNQQLNRTIQYTGELARMERVSIEQAETIIRLAEENERLKAALKPFADNVELSDHSALEDDDALLVDGMILWTDIKSGKLVYRHVRDAAAAYNSTAKPDTLTPEEIEANKVRRGQRMNQIVAATEAGRVKPDTSNVNSTFEA